jgi:hypothetical protein
MVQFLRGPSGFTRDDFHFTRISLRFYRTLFLTSLRLSPIQAIWRLCEGHRIIALTHTLQKIEILQPIEICL